MPMSGRRPTGRASRIGKGFLEGLSILATNLTDAPRKARIKEIDEQIKNLRQERDHLVADLIEKEDYEVSEDYDPHWRKPEETRIGDVHNYRNSSSDGRLTECVGRSTMSRYHGAHPGCPYVDQIHTAHEFTLRD